MKIKRILILLVVLLSFQNLRAQEQEDEPVKTIGIEAVSITARRSLTEIGAQKTEIDTFAVRDNITKSLADVLAQSSSIFVKSYGRGTLSTVSFRGTAPSHTQVTWNDMKLNSPMLGMVDFSLVPSYFIDNVALYHGASSVGVSAGGLGGAITLNSSPMGEQGFSLRYVQGFSSFETFDEFLRIGYGGARFRGSTRVAYVTSKNDFTYTNYRKKAYVYGEGGEITGWSYPVEKNRNGSFEDFHIQQELYYKTSTEDDLSLSAWYLDSHRGVPMLDVNYRDESSARNEQNESTLRLVANWERMRGYFKLYARGGYTYTDLQYLYLGDLGQGMLSEMVHSRSFINTGFGKVGGDYYVGKKWLLAGNVTFHQHFVNSIDRAIVSSDGRDAVIGYKQARSELSAFASIRYRPIERLGFALNIREKLYGEQWSPAIPALFAEYIVSKRWNIVAKASIARNYRYPTLNDLYFMPGGNPNLKPERGFTYDGGVEFGARSTRIDFRGEASVYNSYVDDWILWLPTFKGFWSPVNVKQVHSYGLELKGKLNVDLGSEWRLYLDANYTISKAINNGSPINWTDNSIGKQLVYIPQYSNNITGRLAWKSWAFTYKYVHYSPRYTTSSNETTSKMGTIGAYYMSDISLEKSFSLSWAKLNLKIAVNNLFNEEYESVLSRPMAGRNYGFFIEIIPKFRRH